MTARDQLIAIYLDWKNNYVSIDRFAECNGLTNLQAREVVQLAMHVFDSEHPEL